MSDPHSLLFPGNKSARQNAVRCREVVSESCPVKALVLVELGVKSVVYHGEEKLVKLWEVAVELGVCSVVEHRAIVFWFCGVLFFCTSPRL